MGDRIVYPAVGATNNPYVYVGLDIERGDVQLAERPVDPFSALLDRQVEVHPVDRVQEDEVAELEHIAELTGVEFHEVA